LNIECLQITVWEVTHIALLIWNSVLFTVLLFFFFIFVRQKTFRNIGNPLLLFIIVNLFVNIAGVIITLLKGYSFRTNNTFLVACVLSLYAACLFTGNLVSYLVFGRSTTLQKQDLIYSVPLIRLKFVNILFFCLASIGTYLQIRNALQQLGVANPIMLLITRYGSLDSYFMLSKIVFLWYFLYAVIVLSQILYHMTRKILWNFVSVTCIAYSLFSGDYVYPFLAMFLFYFTNYYLSPSKKITSNIAALCIFLILFSVIVTLTPYTNSNLGFFDKLVPYTFGNSINLSNLITYESEDIPLTINVWNAITLFPLLEKIGNLSEYTKEHGGYYTYELKYGIEGNTFTYIGVVMKSGILFSIMLTFLIGFTNQFCYINREKNLFYFTVNLYLTFSVFGYFASYFFKYFWSVSFVIYIVLFYPLIAKAPIVNRGR